MKLIDTGEKWGTRFPIIQAPMAGVSNACLASEVSNAGALGSLGIGAMGADAAQKLIADFRERSRGPLNVNVFCHQPPRRDPTLEAAWITRLAPHFRRFGSLPPSLLQETYTSFSADAATLRMLVSERPRIVSFHFGLPPDDYLQALREADIWLFASATSITEARACARAGVHAVIAQGFEAGGHRGIFDTTVNDDCLGTLALTRLLVRELDVPVIAAGGIMDGAGISAVLRLGACMAQMGTAFISCPESSADPAYRAALASDAANHTVMTRAISGRPARCLANQFTVLGADIRPTDIPPYPIAYDAGKALNAAAKAAHESGYGAQWAGQGAPLARSMPAAALVATFAQELR